MTSDAPVIVAPNGQPARRQYERCPTCGAGKDKRVSSGFGGTDICSTCGYDYQERTL